MPRIIFSIGPIEIHTSALLLSIGFLISSMIFLKSIQQKRLNMAFMADNYLIFLLCTLIGGRIIYIIFNWWAFSFSNQGNKIFAFLSIWDKGLSFWGSVFSLLIIVSAYAYWKKENTWKWLDALTTPLLIIILFSHLGNFFEGNHYGRETFLPWGVIFEGGNVKYTVPVHPTQIYAFLYTLTIFFLMKFYRPSYICHKNEGSCFFSIMLVYAIFTFLEGFVRGDDVFSIGFLRIDQMVAIVCAIGAFFIIKKRFHENA